MRDISSTAEPISFSKSLRAFSLPALRSGEFCSPLTREFCWAPPQFLRGFCTASSSRFTLEQLDWDQQPRCLSCLAIESPRSTRLDFLLPESRQRFGFGSK